MRSKSMLCNICRIGLTVDNCRPFILKVGSGYCRDCDKIYRKQRYKLHPEKQREATKRFLSIEENKRAQSHRCSVYHREKKFGITEEQFNTKFISQNGLCKICKEPMSGQTRTKVPCLDHCHVTGKLRDLLCTNCNVLLGNCFEKEEILASAIQYLRKHRKDIEMAHSNEETLGGKKKTKVPMAHSRPGTTSHEDEALGGMTKKKEAPAHVGPRSTSNECETLGGMAKKRIEHDSLPAQDSSF